MRNRLFTAPSRFSYSSGVTLWHHSPSAACRDAVGNFLLPVRPQDAFSVQRILIAKISRIRHENLHLCAIASGHHRGGRCVGLKIAVRGFVRQCSQFRWCTNSNPGLGGLARCYPFQLHLAKSVHNPAAALRQLPFDLQLAGLQQFRKRELHWSKRLPDFLRFVLFPSAHRQLTQTSQPKQRRRRRAVPSGVYTSPSRPPIPDQFQSGRRAASHDGSRPDSTTTCFIASANNSSIFEGVGFKHVHDEKFFAADAAHAIDAADRAAASLGE